MSLIHIEIKNKVGILTLNSEKTLNSLSLPMIEELKEVLENWKTSDLVSCVFLQGAGEKALCAGGDVRQLHDAIIEQRSKDATKVAPACLEFFCKEYEVDYLIHTYPKPVIVWGHGIVMGGGIGLMVGASHRIVTERSKLAMPEITIGLYPDVGGTWFLNKMPSAYGLYLGLTGARLDGSDCLFLGLADYSISSTSKEEVLQKLQQIEWSKEAHQLVTDVLNSFSNTSTLPESQAKEHSSFIRLFESIDSVEQFGDLIRNFSEKDDWILNGLKSFEAGSPSSAHIIFRQITNGKQLNLEEVFQSELNLSCQCCIHPDFAEGVRALLVDKDLSPKWQPASLDAVTQKWIDSYFTPLWTSDNHPLKDLGKN